MTKEEAQKLNEQLSYKRKNAFSVMTEQEKISMNEFAKGYMSFLDAAKTEREAVIEGIAIAKKFGYKEYNLGDKTEIGGKYYYNNRGKALLLFAIGSESLEEGIKITAAHTDSPRLDLKQHPLYEDGKMAFLKTHYYGGIKKYQWTSIPLALHGVVMKADGSVVDIVIGEKDTDPVFYINDLLPHLAKDQMVKSLGEGISGEKLNILVGSEPLDDEGGNIKTGILKILNEMYGITEADFISAELSVVPAFKAREIGFDRSLIGGYGHDDRVCAYPELIALLECENVKKTVMAIFADKEEIGSTGATGMQCRFLSDVIACLSKEYGVCEEKVRSNSTCLSADVNAAYDPNFADVYEYNNSSFINHGVVMTKYTGSRGKGGTSDADAEFVGYMRNLFDQNNVVWQTGELGKVDQGGGGTVARYIAEQNVSVVDLGVPVVSMHAPYEVISKADIYMTYKACKVFFEKE